MVTYLEQKNIETRLLFAGNIIRQPGYSSIAHRTVGNLANSDQVLESTFFVGVYPSLAEEHIDYMLQAFESFFEQEHLG